MQKSGIYQIRNLKNDKVYIGSAKSLKDRKNLHFSKLRRGIHHSIVLQRAFNLYGVNSFSFEVIEEVAELKNLIEREQHYFDIRKPEYNICKVAGSSLGVISSRRRSVLQFSTDGILLKEWDSLQQAATAMGVKVSSKMTECCKGYRNKAYGFVWRYQFSTLEFSYEAIRKGKPIAEVDTTGTIINTWARVKDCATEVGTTSITLCKIMNKKDRQKTFKGRVFKKITLEQYLELLKTKQL